MEFTTYLFSFVAGPAKALDEWTQYFAATAKSLGLGDSFELIINDPSIRVPPPGEAYAILQGNRTDPDDQLIYVLPSAFVRMARRYPDLTFYFNAEVGVSTGVRGLVCGACCATLDFYQINRRGDDGFALVNLDRQIDPAPDHRIPEYYIACFNKDSLPAFSRGCMKK